MKKRRFGRIEWQVSEIGFGGWAIGGNWGAQNDTESLQALHKALELGVTFLDTALGYGEGRSERLMGQVLKQRGIKAGEVRIATKIPPVMGGGMDWPPAPWDKADERYPESYLRKSVEQSLKNLGVEALDLIQLHTWTRAWNNDPSPLAVLRQLQTEGKVLAVGISAPEGDPDCVNELMRGGLLDSVQVIYNLFDQEPAAELLPLASKNDVAVIVRCALDEGSLSGKFTLHTKFKDGDFRGHHFRGFRLKETVDHVSELKKDMAQVGEDDLASAAFRFVLANDAVSVVIPGMRTVSQVQRNCAVSDQAPLSQEALALAKKHLWRRNYWDD